MNNLFGLLISFVMLFGSCKKADSGSQVPTPPPAPAETTDLPAGAKDGVTYINSGKSALITLYAPGKKTVSVIGDFNGWKESASNMKNTPDGKTWWVQIDNLDPNTEYAYQFLVDGSLKV
ncbi:MAG: alpha-amylase, partial [Bacteroidota bacterium]|nr:alpha-amylase [Bacteroidota bacterium]